MSLSSNGSPNSSSSHCISFTFRHRQPQAASQQAIEAREKKKKKKERETLTQTKILINHILQSPLIIILRAFIHPRFPRLLLLLLLLLTLPRHCTTACTCTTGLKAPIAQSTSTSHFLRLVGSWWGEGGCSGVRWVCGCWGAGSSVGGFGGRGHLRVAVVVCIRVDG